MEDFDLLIKNGRVYLGGELVTADIVIKDGKTAAILSEEARTAVCGEALERTGRVIDAESRLILPGTVDPHVHIRAPGFEEREDFLSGTRAAANGGVTTIIEHPLANPPQYSLEILNRRIDAARENAVVDFAFYGAAGADFPDQVEELAGSGNIVAFKTFLHEAPAGRDSEFLGLTMKNAGQQYEGMKKIGEVGILCGVHAENNDMINEGIRRQKSAGNLSGIAHGLSRPAISEYETVSKLLLFAEETGARIEFCHISTPEAMEMIRLAKRKGMDVYLETCPHYLLMTEELMEKYGPFAKCNPPLRDEGRAEKLWEYVNDGTVDFIGSDHAPYTYDEKIRGKNDIFACPAGIPGIEMRFPLMMDAVCRGKLTLARMVELLCTNPAKIFGLYPKKGVVQVGSDADFIIVDPTETYTVKTREMFTKCREAALIFDGMRLTGKVCRTIVRGRTIMRDGQVPLENKGYGCFNKPLQR